MKALKNQALPHQVYLIPGMFGFGNLAGYDYFGHLKAGLDRYFKSRDELAEFHEILPAPTSSLKHRARTVARTIAHTARAEAPIHIIGHSTGGLDARLTLAPTIDLGLPEELRKWRPRVKSLVTLNTPHYGTPLASYFATVSGTRMLYALSLLTVITLRVGEPSFSLLSRLLASIGNIDAFTPGDLKLFSKMTDGILRFVDREARSEITDYLSKVQTDQGAVIQITPEAMDLFNAAVENDERIRYGCVISASPRPSTLRAAKKIRSPYAAISAALYSTLYQFSAQAHECYLYPSPPETLAAQMASTWGHEPSEADNDGIVPALSMQWGEVIGIAEGDHLDMLGHFQDSEKKSPHTDWLNSGSKMSPWAFNRLVERLGQYLLASP